MNKLREKLYHHFWLRFTICCVLQATFVYSFAGVVFTHFGVVPILFGIALLLVVYCAFDELLIRGKKK